MLPFAIWWVRHNEKIALRLGRPLSDDELDWARKLGILHPENVRVLNVTRIPSPVPEFIEKKLQKCGFPVGNAAGMCMRYGIYLAEEYSERQELLAHELVHTHQFERLGGLYSFLRIYLYETMFLGYRNAPLEAEANNKADQVLA